MRCSPRLRGPLRLRVKKWFFREFRDALPVRLRFSTKCPSQRHRSRETAIERSTETARQRRRRALLVSLLEPILDEDAVEARSLAKMKDEADLEIRRREASQSAAPAHLAERLPLELGSDSIFIISTRTPASATCDAPVLSSSGALALRGTAFERTRTPEHQSATHE